MFFHTFLYVVTYFTSMVSAAACAAKYGSSSIGISVPPEGTGKDGHNYAQSSSVHNGGHSYVPSGGIANDGPRSSSQMPASSPAWSARPSKSLARSHDIDGNCRTLYGRTPGPQSISTSFLSRSCASTRTITSVSTVTPTSVLSITTTTSITTLTDPTSYSTATETSTSTIAITSSTVSVIILTETSTTVIGTTSSIFPPTSFIPVQSSLPGATYDESGGPDPVGKRDLQDTSKRTDTPFQGSSSNMTYVQRVVCPHSSGSAQCAVHTTTITSKATAPIPTLTSIITSVSTSVITPHANTTITTTILATSVATSTLLATTTTTITTTSTTAVATVYAACAEINFADGDSNDQDTAIEDFGTFLQFTQDSSDSAYDCCVSAFNSTFGTAAAFAYDAGNNGLCSVGFVGDSENGFTCTSQSQNQLTATLTPSFYTMLVIGNGPCGEYTTTTVSLS